MTLDLGQALYGRISALLDDAVIRTKTRIRPPRLRVVEGESSEVTEARLRVALEAIFVPTQQVCTLIRQIVGAALGFCVTRYCDNNHFLRQLYADPFPDESWTSAATCLTGLGGIGKSQLVAAIERLLHIEAPMLVDEGHGPFYSNHCISISFRDSRSQFAALAACAFPPGHSILSRTPLKLLTTRAKWRAFRDFSILMLADECQFINRGESSDLATTTLLTLLGTKIPLTYVANFSLCHKLLRRAQEDRHRLIVRPLVMHPDCPGPDWREYLTECRRVAGPWLQLHVRDDEYQLFLMTFGIKRIFVHLVCIAYRHMHMNGRRSVTLADLRQAYLSPANGFRQEVEELLAQLSAGVAPRKDLLCPFEDNSPFTHVASELRKRREAEVVQAYTEQSLSVAERQAFTQLNHANEQKEQKATLPKRPKAPPLSAAALLAANAKLDEASRPRR